MLGLKVTDVPVLPIWDTMDHVDRAGTLAITFLF